MKITTKKRSPGEKRELLKDLDFYTAFYHRMDEKMKFEFDLRINAIIETLKELGQRKK